MAKLAVIVPYRNRQEHATEFLPAISSYLDKTEIDYRVYLVQQSNDDQPFNRGAIKNVGFQLVRDRFDYLAFHDVDHLPINVDYSKPAAPTGVAGSVGGVVLVSQEDFLTANGYSNLYWGWGYEDNDLARRLATTGAGFNLRRSKFQILPHRSEAFARDPQFMSVDNDRNRKLFESKWLPPTSFAEDGLSSVKYTILSSGLLGPKSQLTTVRLELS